MSDFWIKVEKSTPDKPEVFEIAEILDIDPDAVVGKLVRVWSWVDSNSANGHIKSVTSVLIDRLVSHKGFANAMRQVGWLTDTEVPNFDRHLGKSAKKRANDAERKRMSRERSHECHKESVTESGLDKSRVDNIKENNKKKKTSLSGRPDDSECDEVIDYLNLKAGTSFRKIETNRNLIRPRLRDHTVHDCKLVIEKKVLEWQDTEWQKFLRPKTLFQASKFEGYLNQPDQPKPGGNGRESLAARRERETNQILSELQTPQGYDRLMGSNGAALPSQVDISRGY